MFHLKCKSATFPFIFLSQKIQPKHGEVSKVDTSIWFSKCSQLVSPQYAWLIKKRLNVYFNFRCRYKFYWHFELHLILIQSRKAAATLKPQLHIVSICYLYLLDSESTLPHWWKGWRIKTLKENENVHRFLNNLSPLSLCFETCLSIMNK